MKARSEDTPAYGFGNTDMLRMADDKTIDLALKILRDRLDTPGEAMTAPATTKNFFVLKLAKLEHEVFACMWLDTQYRVMDYEELFRGTLTQTSVYPREVLKSALKRNAGAVIFAHNHPSGFAEPSRADELLTSELKQALALVDVRVLDHIIVGGTSTLSFAERGLI